MEASVGLRLGELELDVELEVEPGEVVVLLGPNGAGKTTFLRILAGGLRPDRGRVVLAGRLLEDTQHRVRVDPEERGVGMVFQDQLLFPHLSVLENVAFGLRARGTDHAAAKLAASRWLDRVGLGAAGRSRPSALSGGQRQRVALARALAAEPLLLLLDEPLSALDASIRTELRQELRRHLRDFAGVNLLVTHDPLEALTLADRLVVIERGRIVQSGLPTDVAAQPRSAYVADLVGVNLFKGRALGNGIELDGGGRLEVAGNHQGQVLAVVPPRSVSLWRNRPDGSPRNLWPGRAAGLELLGDRVRVRIEGRPSLVAEVTPASAADMGLAGGGVVWVSIKATEVTVYPA